MIDLKTLPLVIGSYERKDETSTMFKNTRRDGWGCIIKVDTNEAVFSTWKPIGATILRENISSNEDIISLLKQTSDIISYKRKKFEQNS